MPGFGSCIGLGLELLNTCLGRPQAQAISGLVKLSFVDRFCCPWSGLVSGAGPICAFGGGGPLHAVPLRSDQSTHDLIVSL